MCGWKGCFLAAWPAPAWLGCSETVSTACWPRGGVNRLESDEWPGGGAGAAAAAEAATGSLGCDGNRLPTTRQFTQRAIHTRLIAIPMATMMPSRPSSPQAQSHLAKASCLLESATQHLVSLHPAILLPVGSLQRSIARVPRLTSPSCRPPPAGGSSRPTQRRTGGSAGWPPHTWGTAPGSRTACTTAVTCDGGKREEGEGERGRAGG